MIFGMLHHVSIKGLGRFGRALVLALTMFSFVMPAPALAAPPVVINVTGRNAFATFTFTDGCIFTEVMVSGYSYAGKFPPGMRENWSVANINIAQVDQCTGKRVLYGSYSTYDLPKGALKFTGSKISLQVSSVTMLDHVSWEMVSLSFQVEWQKGARYNEKKTYPYQVHLPDCFFNRVIRSEGFDATAQGSVTVGGTTIPLTHSAYGFIFRGDYHIVEKIPCDDGR